MYKFHLTGTGYNLAGGGDVEAVEIHTFFKPERGDSCREGSHLFLVAVSHFAAGLSRLLMEGGGNRRDWNPMYHPEKLSYDVTAVGSRSNFWCQLGPSVPLDLSKMIYIILQ